MSIFTPSESYRPFKKAWAVEAEKEQRIDMAWHENQIDLSDDLRQYNTKDGMKTDNVSHENNKAILDNLLMLFTEMDASVGNGYTKLLPFVKNNEVRTMMIQFCAKEVVHQRSYALAAESFGFTNAEWTNFQHYTEMTNKLDIVTQEVGDLSVPLNFAKYLTVILMGEGIGLFGAFACLLNLKRHGLMMGFNVVNQWSLADEAKHVEYNMRTVADIVENDLTQEESIELDMFTKAVVEQYRQAEHTFLDLVFKLSDQEGMTKQDAKAYIDYLCEVRLSERGITDGSSIGENPLPWMDYILSGSKQTNFFEQRVTEYSHSGLHGDVDYAKFQVLLDEKIYA